MDLGTKAPTLRAPQDARRFSRRKISADGYDRNIEQLVVVRMESISRKNKPRKKGEQTFALRRASTIVGMKDGFGNDFSFKNSIDSYHGGDQHSQSSSRHHYDNSVVNISQETNKMNSIDHGNSNSFGIGLKRAMTPSFTGRPSGFFLERHDSLRNRPRVMTPPIMSNQSITSNQSGYFGGEIPKNLEFETQLAQLQTQREFIVSDRRFSIGSPKKSAEQQMSQIDLGFGMLDSKLSKRSISESQATSERMMNKQQSPTHLDLHLEAVQENSFDNTRAGSTVFRDEPKEKEHAEQRRSEKKLSMRAQSPTAMQSATLHVPEQQFQAKPVALLEPLTVKISPEQHPKLNRSSSGSISESRLQSVSTLPVRALPLLKQESSEGAVVATTKSAVQTVISPKTELSSILKSGRSHSSSFPAKDGFVDFNQRPHGKKFFNSSSQLSVKDKFKRNLLDIVNDEDDDISPIISSKSKPVSTIAKSLFPAKFPSDEKGTKPEKSKLEADRKNQKETSENSPLKPLRENPRVKETQQIPQLIHARSKPDNSMTQSVTLPRKGVDKVNKNLLALARDDHVDQESVPAANQLLKVEKTPTNELLAVFPTIQSNVSSLNNLRLPENDHLLSSRLGVGSNQNIQNQTLLTVATPNHLNETSYNPSFYNLDGNVTAMNVSNYVFYYDNEEVEYDEAKGMLTSRNQDQKILTGINNSPSNRNSGLSPMNQQHPRMKSMEERRDSVWPGRQMQLMSSTSPMNRKDSVTTQTSSPLQFTKKESFTSCCSGGIPNFGDTNQTIESPIMGRQQSDSIEDPAGGASPLNLKTLIQPVDNIKHKPIRISIFHQGADGVTETGTTTVTTIQENDNIPTTTATTTTVTSTTGNTLTPNQYWKSRPAALDTVQPRFNKSKSCVLSPLVETANESQYSASQKMDEFQTEGQGLKVPTVGDEKNLLLTPPSSIADLTATMQRRTLSTPKSPALVVLKRTQTNVIETSKLDKTRDDEGQKKINQYLLIKDIGR